MRKRNRITAFDVLNWLFLALVALACIIPFITVIGTSLVSQEEWSRRSAFVLFPEKIDFSAYRVLLGNSQIVFRGLLNSVERVLIGTACNLLVTITYAYVISRKRLPGRIFLTYVLFFTMIFNGGLIPTYILVDSLRLTNSFWALVLPTLLNPWWLLIMRNFFAAIPEEFEEAAVIDGAKPTMILVQLILPMSLASVATIGLFYAVHHWNEWFAAFIYINDGQKLPLQVILRSILIQGLMTESDAVVDIRTMPPSQSIKNALIVITTLPILMVYPFVQRYFVKGVMVGGIKG